MTLARAWHLAGAGLIAQVLTMGAMFLPIVFGLTQALVYAVQVGAVAAVLISIVTLGAAVRMPALRSGAYAVRELRVTTLTVLAIGVLLSAGAGGLAMLYAPGALLVGGVALLLTTQGLYVVVAAVVTRQGDYRVLMQMRLAYAASAALGTLISCLTVASGISLVLSSSIGFIIGLVPALDTLRVFVGNRAPQAEVDASRQETSVAGRLPLLSSFLLGGLATQLPSIFITAMGDLAVAWAVAARMSGGVQTVALQLIAPAVDIGASRAFRDGDAAQLRRALSLASRWGVALATTTMVGTAIGLQLVSVDSGVGLGGWLAYWCAVIGYAAGGSFLGPMSRTLAMVGGVASAVRWNTLRVLFAAIAVAVFPYWGLLLLGVGGATTALYYVVLCRQAAQRLPVGR